MKAKDEKRELEKLIDQAAENLNENVPSPNQTPELQSEPSFEIDYEKIQKDCDKQAKKMIKNATGLMMNDEIVKTNQYLKNKMDVDVLSLADMLYQLQTNKLMQKALMEEVRHGAMQARMFEVFGQLTKTINEINKQLLQTVEAIKSTYRDLRDDIRQNSEELKALGTGDSGLMRNSKGLVTMGSKELINQTKRLKLERYKEDNNIEDAQTMS